MNAMKWLFLVGAVASLATACGDDDEGKGGGTGGSATGGSGTGGSGTGAAATGGGAGAANVLDIAVCDPENGPFSLTIDNPYFPLAVGQKSVFDGEEDGVPVHLEITVLDETEDVAGVTTRVVEERELEDDVLVEISRNFFAQAPDGTVCYFGEEVDIYDDTGTNVESHEGAWVADGADNRPGIIMPNEDSIELNVEYDQEAAPGVAEDHAKIVAIGESITVPAGTFDETINTEETTPLEPGNVSEKSYAKGVGLLEDGDLKLTSY